MEYHEYVYLRSDQLPCSDPSDTQLTQLGWLRSADCDTPRSDYRQKGTQIPGPTFLLHKDRPLEAISSFGDDHPTVISSKMGCIISKSRTRRKPREADYACDSTASTLPSLATEAPMLAYDRRSNFESVTTTTSYFSFDTNPRVSSVSSTGEPISINYESTSISGLLLS